jgi:hypothetical protein
MCSTTYVHCAWYYVLRYNSQTEAALRKQAAKAQKEQRAAHLNHIMDAMEWRNPKNFIVEDDILKQIAGFDSSHSSVDMLQKICTKLGFDAALHLFTDKTIHPSTKFPCQSWETLRDMFIAVQKDYYVKYQQFKISGNHSNNFHYFCHGRLDTCYLHA